MMKYQEPQMEIINIGSFDVITDSVETLYPSGDQTGGSSTGGGAGGNWPF